MPFLPVLRARLQCICAMLLMLCIAAHSAVEPPGSVPRIASTASVQPRKNVFPNATNSNSGCTPLRMDRPLHYKMWHPTQNVELKCS